MAQDTITTKIKILIVKENTMISVKNNPRVQGGKNPINKIKNLLSKIIARAIQKISTFVDKFSNISCRVRQISTRLFR